MLPSGRFSRLALVVAGLLAATLLGVIFGVRSPAASILLSDVLQSSVVLWAAYCALHVARHSRGYLRQLWMLLACALAIATAAQMVETYYQNVAHTASVSPWPSDILFFFWVTPAIIMFLPRQPEETAAIHWEQVLDIAQAGVVVLTAYLYFFYAPSRWEAEGLQMVLKVQRLQALRDAVLAAGFAMQAARASARSLRTFFGRMAGFFFLASASGLAPLYQPRTLPIAAAWTDFAWCTPYLFAAVFAAAWNVDEEPVPKEGWSPFRALVFSQVLPVVIPLLVLFMGRWIAEEQLTLAWIAIGASFVISAARLVLTNRKQRVIAENLLRTQQALRASEERFRNLVQDLNVGVILLGPNAETLFANRAVLSTLGMSEEQTRGKSSSALGMNLIREDGTEIPFSMRPGPRAIATRQPIRNEVLGVRSPNTNVVIWTLVDAAPHFNPDGEITNVILTVTDITELKKAEEALRASEERFRSLVQNLHVGFVVTGPQREIQFANQACLAMFGLKEEQLLGKKFADFGLFPLNEDGTEMSPSMMPGSRAIANRAAVRNEVVAWRREGSNKIVWTLGEAVPVFAENGELDRMISSFSDITEHKQAEEALRHLSTRLLQVQDEERRRLGRELHDSLAQSVLAVNLNLAQVARPFIPLDEKAKRALSEARRVLQEMSREIRTLAYLLHPPLLDELGLVSALKEYVEGFSQRSGIRSELELQKGFGRLPQEVETTLFRVIQESLTNIQRHSGSQTARVRLRGDVAGVNLEIGDEGKGMEKMALERDDGARARMGVGILGMRERITQLGGKLEIESNASGTTVRVTLPMQIEGSDARSHPGSR